MCSARRRDSGSEERIKGKTRGKEGVHLKHTRMNTTEKNRDIKREERQWGRTTIKKAKNRKEDSTQENTIMNKTNRGQSYKEKGEVGGK